MNICHLILRCIGIWMVSSAVWGTEASAPWAVTFDLPLSSSGSYDSVDITSNGDLTLLTYSDRTRVYYGFSNDGGMTFSSFQSITPQAFPNVYGVKVVAAMSPGMVGRFMICMLSDGNPYYYEYRNGEWFHQYPYMEANIYIIDATACSVTEGKDGTWVIGAMFYDTYQLATHHFYFSERLMNNTDPASWPEFREKLLLHQDLDTVNFASYRTVDGFKIQCTHAGNCFVQHVGLNEPIDMGATFGSGRDNFMADYAVGIKQRYDLYKPGHALALVVDDNVTAEYFIGYHSASASWNLYCYYNTFTQIHTNFSRLNTYSIPGYSCPSYTITGQGGVISEWRFTISAANHFHAGALSFIISAIRVKNGVVLYRENIAFTSLDGWKTFSQQILSTGMTYATRYVTNSIAITKNAFVAVISGNDQAKVMRKPHSLGGYGISTHSMFDTTTPTKSPTLQPTTLTPSSSPTATIPPTTLPPTANPPTTNPPTNNPPTTSTTTNPPTTSPPTTATTTNPPTTLPPTTTTTAVTNPPTTTTTVQSTAAPTSSSQSGEGDESNGGLPATTTSALAAAGATIGAVALFAVVNAVFFVKRYGDQMAGLSSSARAKGSSFEVDMHSNNTNVKAFTSQPASPGGGSIIPFNPAEEV